MMNNELILGYDLSYWNIYYTKSKISIDISSSENSHMVISGLSGSGKSYLVNQIFRNLIEADEQSEFYFADYKQDDSFEHLRGLSRYYSYKDSLEALEIVYERLNKRLSGEDISQNQVTLIWDEYIANILALINDDKKLANIVMNKVSEILLMGRSKGIRLIVSCQRPDALAFPVGSRMNFGVIIILGAHTKSIVEMLIPDFIEEIKEQTFLKGEGSVVLQGSELRLIKVPTIRNVEDTKNICTSVLSK